MKVNLAFLLLTTLQSYSIIPEDDQTLLCGEEAANYIMSCSIHSNPVKGQDQDAATSQSFFR